MKISVKFVGLIAKHKNIDLKSFLLCTLYEKLSVGHFEHERLKPAVIRTSKGNVTTLPQSKQVFHMGIKCN